MTTQPVQDHFEARAQRYNLSSHWCTDEVLGETVLRLVAPKPTDQVLDVACGTGLVSRLFTGKVARVVGADITRAMYEQARQYLDELVVTSAEELPFPAESFDVVVCRQGVQFMDDSRAVAEMVRVLKPGGRVCLIHLCAYGDQDKESFFEILRLRNPVRRNFYLRDDFSRLLANAGCSRVELHDHVSIEEINNWSDNRAISESNRQAIRDVYQAASPAYREIHHVEISEQKIIDHMLFCVALGIK